MIIGQHIPISVFHTIILVGVRIGHGITDVFIQHIGIRGTGVQPFMQGITIIHIPGGMGIFIIIMIAGVLMVAINIRAHLHFVILEIKEVATEVHMVSNDQHQMLMLDRDQYEKVSNYPVMQERQYRLVDIALPEVHVMATAVYRRAAKQPVVDIILVFSNRAIGIKVHQQTEITG
jgi:hypothetical protein